MSVERGQLLVKGGKEVGSERGAPAQNMSCRQSQSCSCGAELPQQLQHRAEDARSNPSTASALQDTEGQLRKGRTALPWHCSHSGFPGSVALEVLLGVMINPGRAGTLAAGKGRVLLCSLGTAWSWGGHCQPLRGWVALPGFSWHCWGV